MIRFGFYGRVSTEDNQDPESSRGWQLTRSRTLIEPRGGQIVAEFFDVDKSRSVPWQRRPQATALLAELKNPDRGFDAVVIGEPHRASLGPRRRVGSLGCHRKGLVPERDEDGYHSKQCADATRLDDGLQIVCRKKNDIVGL